MDPSLPRHTPSSELFANPLHFVILRLISLYSFCSPPSSRVTSALSLRPLPSFCTVFPALIPSLLLVFYSSGIARSVFYTSLKTIRRRSVAYRSNFLWTLSAMLPLTARLSPDTIAQRSEILAHIAADRSNKIGMGLRCKRSH
jgi:hypothetical protein